MQEQIQNEQKASAQRYNNQIDDICKQLEVSLQQIICWCLG